MKKGSRLTNNYSLEDDLPKYQGYTHDDPNPSRTTLPIN